FAEKRFSEGDVIECAPVLLVPEQDVPLLDRTFMIRYTYSWGPELDGTAIGLGYSSLYNHSFRPNAQYLKRHTHQLLEIRALRTIEPGEEITINYNGSPDDATPLEFDVVD